MSVDKSDEHFAEVDEYTTESKTVIIPNGKTWEVQAFVGAAAYISDTKALLVWDFGEAGEEVIYSTHGDGGFKGARQFVGDGSKKLAICLVNDSAAAQQMGGQYIAKELV